MARHHIPKRELHRRFLSILPRIRLHAKICFRYIRCWHTREDRIAEVIDLAWRWFVRLAEKGKDARRFASVLASYAARAVKSGRRLCGQLKSKDVLSELAQQRRGFFVGKLPDFSTLSENPLAEALADNTVTPVDEQAAFRLDFPAWRASYDDRRRRIMDALAMGERTQDVAKEFGMSQGRVSQLRREFMQDWKRFTGGT
jgi:hypothetical protein